MARLSSPFRVLALLAALAATGCGDDGVSPPAALDGAAASSHHLPGHLRTGKYRDSGARPATGRSGSAVLSARAVLWRDGVVRLLVTTGDLDRPTAAPGELAKVQLRIFSPEGLLLSTANHNRLSSGGSHEFRLPGLVPGSRIEVQANVRGIDRNRTSVVTVTETVRLPGGLSAVLDPLARAVAGVPAVLSATVSETGGETGVYTSCTLRVEQVEVERIENVWVDAGDAVSCAFTHTFPSSGHFHVSVEVDGGPPGMGILAPPPASGMVEVVGATPGATSHASVLDRTVATGARFDQSWLRPDGSGREYSRNTGEAPRTQTATLTGTLGRAAVLPLATVQLRLSSTEGEWQTAAWSAVGDATTDGAGTSCVHRWVPEHGGHFYLCTTGATTTYAYTRFAGTVTYHSRGSIRTWEGVSSQATYWSWNDEYQTHAGGGQLRPLGEAVTIDLTIEDGQGRLGANVTVPVTRFEEPATGTPYTCRDEQPWWLDGGTMTTCESTTERVYGWRGEVTG
jgi:hypothetical protein